MCYFLICYSKGWYKVCCVYKHIVISFISNSDLLLTEVRATSKYQKGHSYRKDPLDHKGFTPTYCNLSVPKCSSYPSVPLPVFPLLFSPWLCGIFLKRDISVWFVKLEYLCKNCQTFSPFPHSIFSGFKIWSISRCFSRQGGKKFLPGNTSSCCLCSRSSCVIHWHRSTFQVWMFH